MIDRIVSLRAMTLLRVFVGPIVLYHLSTFLDDARHGHIYRDAFYEPYASWYPELPRSAYVALLCIGCIAAIGMTLQVWSRRCTAVAFGVVAYNLFLSTTHFHNNRAYLVIVLGCLSAVPGEIGPAWPLTLLRIEASVVYGASGLSKLLDGDWFGGTVTWGRVVRVQDRVPAFAVSVLTNRSLHTGLAKVIIATELFIAVGLWLPRTRLIAVWVAVLFHLSIAVTADVEVFSILGIAALVIWATPSTGDLVATVPRRWVLLIEQLDWLARFRVREGPTDRESMTFVLSRLPLTAWFVLPLRARDRLRAWRRSEQLAG